jgi:epoxyqueuosine reductase
MTSCADTNLSTLIKRYAVSLGFDLCGIASSKALAEHRQILKKWIAAGMNGEMNYFRKNLEKRINPGLLVNGAKSIIVAGLNYFTEKKQGGNGIPVISKYAYGTDYHFLLKELLNKLLEYIVSLKPDAEGQIFVDTAPILEKAWAKEAGLGWIGRHSVLINKEIGSFLFLGEVVLNIDLQCDSPYSDDHCSNCRSCIEACPTYAINENRTIDTRKCISYLTVTNKNPIPYEFEGKMNNRVLGCDICQDVCPWNKNAKPHKNPELEISSEFGKMRREEWLSLSKEKYQKIFNRSSVRRVTYERFMRNILFITKNKN